MSSMVEGAGAKMFSLFK
ncbi:Calcium-dependent secretion activator [Caenorhabditis elegans]|uniref:Isoform f of Calcium-dependent secretion activator n=2 Tax=Caenorhabditis TaxID=6237 RepID=Q23658-6|nr:Calcium-dependent secretion activator [Caenorhabditis elegans]CBK19529.1 Calcium-dependent secretion activator [Caenorhabditis elegans]|eukprot:NP_001255671.1 Calcium-dependent secretion activator [Caenorhabditis elegans]